MRFLPLALLACEPISLGGKDSADALESADDVAALCASQTPETTNLIITFDEENSDCPWGEDDNVDAEDGVYTARIESTEALTLPADAVICDVGYNFQIDPATAQEMRYDDHMVLNFNDVVIAASTRQFLDVLPTEGTFTLWDWSAIAGLPIDWEETDSWCYGEDDGLASCTIPSTDTPGDMELDFDPSVVAELSYRAVQQGQVAFTFVTIGDNDPGSDCTHNEFKFEVALTYVTSP